mmetsp:Transcript_540/g.1695  ORF Transcript_540/g.1695 Transcript_540/m.1695 type:complete len:443 (+) Transcript_540:49-1377(+)
MAQSGNAPWPSAYAALAGGANKAPFTPPQATFPLAGRAASKLVNPTLVINLIKGILGSGLLCLPFALQESGLGLGLITLTFMAIMSLGGFLAIGYTCHITGASSYRQAWQRSVGVYPAIVDVMILLECVITGIGFVILTLDYTSTGLRGLWEFEAGPNLRPKIAAAMTIFILMPLNLRTNLESLKSTSTLGNCILLYTILYVILEYAGCDHGMCSEMGDLMTMYGPKRDGIFRAVGMMTSAYIAHYSAPDHMASVSSRPRPWKTFYASVVVAFAVALVAYILFAGAGFMRFGPEAVMGNILLNYEGMDSSHNIMAAWLGMAMMLLCTFPLSFKPARDTVAKALEIDDGVDEGSPRFAWSLATVIMVGLTVIMGVILQDISKIMALRGAVLGCPISFTMPGLMLWYCPEGNHPNGLQKPAGAALFVFGIFAGLMGLVCTFMDT